MPSAPLLDPTTIDTNTLVATVDDLKKVLKQRGRFFLLDGVSAMLSEPDRVVGFKEIRADDWWASDHIPGRPIFPGVLMIEAAAHLCSYDYMMRHHKGEDFFLGFGGTNETRFRGLVAPPCRLVFVAEARRVRKSLFTYYAQAFVGSELVFESEIMGVAV